MSVRHKGDSSNGVAKKKKKPKVELESEKKRGKQRGDVGRALRSIYDDTLREPVPDDFKDLLGKLS